MGNRSNGRKVMKFQKKEHVADMKNLQEVFARLQSMPYWKRRKLARQLMGQYDIRRAAKKHGVRFGAFRKKHGIPR